MVSEPNFILGIKQTSLASKEDSHVHTTIRSHTCLSAGSRLHGISQSVPLPIRSVHIKPSPDETNKTKVLHSISWTKPRHPTSNGSLTRHHTRTMAPGTLTRAAEGSWLPAWISATHAAKTALSSLDLLSLRIWWSYELTRASRVSLSQPRAGNTVMCLPRPEELLLMSSDVTGWRHRSTSACHARPSPRHQTCHLATSAVSPRQHHVT